MELTNELWLEKKTIPEIAAIRKFTQETIFSHFTKLIQAETVTGLKEKYGDTFSWEELRMFKASLKLH